MGNIIICVVDVQTIRTRSYVISGNSEKVSCRKSQLSKTESHLETWPKPKNEQPVRILKGRKGL